MLHFYFGVMGSSKTAMLLMQRYNYLQLGLKVALVKPAIDTRAGVNIVYSLMEWRPVLSQRFLASAETIQTSLSTLTTNH